MVWLFCSTIKVAAFWLISLLFDCFVSCWKFLLLSFVFWTVFFFCWVHAPRRTTLLMHGDFVWISYVLYVRTCSKSANYCCRGNTLALISWGGGGSQIPLNSGCFPVTVPRNKQYIAHLSVVLTGTVLYEQVVRK